jgi:peptidyl-prolyl cis-trans isomerase C
MKKDFCFYLMGAVLVMASGLAWSQATPPVVPQTTQPTTQKATDVIATVGDQKLTRGEFDMIKKVLAPQLPADQEARLVEFWKMSTVLGNEARKSGIEKKEDVQPTLKLLWNKTLGDLYVQSQMANVTVTDEEIKAYYEANKERPEFHEGAYITGKIIASDKREDIDAIKKELTEGKDFDKLFEANIEKTKKVTGLSDPAINNVLSTQLASNLGQPIAGAMAMVTVNEVIGPRFMPDNKGFVLFKVTERKPGAMIPVEKMSEQIRGFLLSDKKMKINQEIRQKVEKEAGIQRQMPPMGPGAGPRPAPAPQATQPAAK